MLSAFKFISADAGGDIMGLLSFFLTSGWSGNLCWSGLTEYNFLQFGCKGSGVFHASSSLRSQRRIRCRLENVTTPMSKSYRKVGKQALTKGTHVFSGLSRKLSRACRRPRLLIYWISPLRKFRAKEYFSATNCKVSSASAWASVMAGIWGLRVCSPYPVNKRRVYWMTMWPSSQ